jgi:5-methylcytosine-specific restriction endonuclease McrA
VTLVCVTCEQPFERKAYQEDWSTERGPFCSIPCHAMWQSHPNSYSSKHHQRQRAIALDRDGHRCVECGATEQIQVHHRVPWQRGQPDPHALDNLVTLCVFHHHQAHRALSS